MHTHNSASRQQAQPLQAASEAKVCRHTCLPTFSSSGSLYQMVWPPCSLVRTSWDLGFSQGLYPFCEQYHTFSGTVATRLMASPNEPARPAMQWPVVRWPAG